MIVIKNVKLHKIVACSKMVGNNSHDLMTEGVHGMSRNPGSRSSVTSLCYQIDNDHVSQIRYKQN